MIGSAPGSSAPNHSTGTTPAVTSSPTTPDPGLVEHLGGGPTGRPFWQWAIAYVLFWLIITALHEYGGLARGVGDGFAVLVLGGVILTLGGKAMTNATALFQQEQQ
jgi:hypothetical protein